MRGIAAILAKSFGLPVPHRVTVYVYGGRRAFEQGLIQDARVSPVLAAELSDFAIGVGARGQVLLNDAAQGAPRRTDREWLRLIAHELTHVSQIELAGGEGRGEQWLAEGMAGRRRLTATAGMRRHTRLFQDGLDLEARGTPRGFAAWHVREGALPTYQLAFLMADYLIERRGLDRMTAYFASFKDSADRRANFQSSFSGNIADFETDVIAHLKTASAL